MDFKIKENYTIEDLVTIVSMLRDKDNGCPWDKAQTHKSIRKNFIEETYEVVEAIDSDDAVLMQEELGDVLLQVLLHAQFKKEEGVFDFEDVVDGISKKLILRHPHIFKGEDNKTVEGVLERWENIKKQEKGHVNVSQTIEAVPKSFPALMYAQKMQKRIAAGGCEVKDTTQLIEDMQDRLEQIKYHMENDRVNAKELALMLYDMVSLTRRCKYDAEEILSLKCREIAEIFPVFENLLLQNNYEFGTISYDQFSRLWLQSEQAIKQKI